MNRRVVAGLALLVVLGGVAVWVLQASHKAAPAIPETTIEQSLPIAVLTDSRPGAYDDFRRLVAYLQSNLERVAAGQEPWPLPAKDDAQPLTLIVTALAQYLRGDMAGMDASLTEMYRRLPDLQPAAIEWNGVIDLAERRPGGIPEAAFYLALDHASRQLSDERGSALARLFAALRKADAWLYYRHTGPVGDNTNPLIRGANYYPEPMLLALPCRVLLGRAVEMAALHRQFGPLSVNLLSCPDYKYAAEVDYAALEKQWHELKQLPVNERKAPAGSAAPRSQAPQATPALPWNLQQAIGYMAENPDAAEPLLAKAAEEAPRGILDYILFLHAFRSADPMLRQRIEALSKKLWPYLSPYDENSSVSGTLDEPVEYDGSDESLIAFIRWASFTGKDVQEKSYRSYLIPCAVLQARPELIEATVPAFYSGNDYALPASGCGLRGDIRGFPTEAVEAFQQASTAADGDFLNSYQGTMVKGHYVEKAATLSRVALNPRYYLEFEDPGVAFPYEMWGLASLANYRISLRVKQYYENALEALVRYYAPQNLSDDERRLAARNGLFSLVYGADCGAGMMQDAIDLPQPAAGVSGSDAIRRGLLERAPLSEIAARIAGNELKQKAQAAGCGWAEPLLHSAIGYHEALPLLLKAGIDVNEGNFFGKTALMAAAQFDLQESMGHLLQAGAQVNTSTWLSQDTQQPLRHDARTPLMYAAANASLPIIKRLLRAGADPYQADTQGRRAIDYLLGYGPVPPNPKLLPEEMAEAARLLF
ncbi:ankyrin repeat domain-containing protein [Ferrovibrio sp.]|uniref:ankyrin repeat domain-containing protein n=1 Tax=Ferrovibrio sp. TaxID=1917215 RepID=UPI003D11F7A8